MKNKLFHRGFFLDTLKRIKGFSIIVIATSIIISAISAITMLVTYTSALSNKQFFEIKIISLFDMVSLVGTLAVISAPVLTIAAFSYLFKRNESDFFEALPIKRSDMAFSGIVVVMSVFTTAIVGSAFIFALITIPCMGNYYTVDALNFVLELAAVLIAATIGSSFTLVAISITGTIVGAILSAGSLLVVPRILMGRFTSTLEMLNPTLVKGRIIPFFNSQFNLYYSLLTNDFHARESAWNYVYSLIIAVIAVFVSMLLLEKRGSEWATQNFVKNAPRHVISILIVFVPLSFAIQCLLDFDNMGILGIVVLILSFVAFVIFERATISKGDKNHGGFLALMLLLVLTIIWCLGISITNKEFKKYSPKANEIDYVSVMYDAGNSDDWFSELFDEYRTYDQYVSMRSENIQLRDEETKKIVCEAIEAGSVEESNETVAIVVKVVSDGKATYRKLYISYEDYNKIHSSLRSNSKYNELWLNISKGSKYPHSYFGGVYVYADTLGDVLETMEKEIRESGIDTYRNGGNAVCEITYTVYYRGEKYNVSISVYDYMTKTLAKLEEARKIVAEREMAEFKEEYKTAAHSGNISYLSINCYIEDEYYYIAIDDPDFDYDAILVDLEKMICTDSIDGYNNQINISIIEGGLLGSSHYYSFSLKEGCTSEQLKAFFAKYEGNYAN